MNTPTKTLSTKNRWDTINNIKFSPKRTLIKKCPICRNLFTKPGPGKKKYCSVKCAKKAKKQQTRKSDQEKIKNRNPLKHRNMMRDLYHEKRLRKNKTLNGTVILPKTPLKESTSGGGNL